MNVKDILVQASGGNPGALKVLMEIAKTDTTLLALVADNMKRTGSESYEIWCLFSDVCDCDINKTKEKLVSWIINGSPKSIKDSHEGIR